MRLLISTILLASATVAAYGASAQRIQVAPLSVISSIDSSDLDSVSNPATCGTAGAPSWCSGSDIGAWVNSAIAYQKCGSVHIPAGTYHQTTMIVRSLCIVLSGDGSNPGGTELIWDGSASYAVQDGTAAHSPLFPSGGLRGILFKAGLGTASAGVLLGCDTSASSTAPSCSSYAKADVPNPINTFWQDVEVYGFTYGIVQGGYAWGFHCTSCKILFNTIDGVLVQHNIPLGGEEMTFDFSSISNNGRYAFNLFSYPYYATQWTISHSSVDFNNSNGNGIQLYGSINLVASHIEQSTGLMFDTSIDPGGYINDFGSTFVLDTGPTKGHDCFGTLAYATASNFIGSTFYSGTTVNNLICGSGNYNLVGVVLTGAARNSAGINYSTGYATWGVAARLAPGRDLNTVCACGNYDGTNLVSAPPGFTGFLRIRNDCSNDRTSLTQTAWDMGNNTNREFVRRASASTWTPWEEVITPDDHGAQTLGGRPLVIPTRFSAPPIGACAVGDIATNSAATSLSTTLYVCYPANVWHPINVP